MMPNSGAATGSLAIRSVASCAPNAAPIAVLNARLINGKPMIVSFDASGSFDPDATSSDPQLRDTIINYVFDFGDGSAAVATTNPLIQHQYSGVGTWGATLLVQDSRGKVSDTAARKQVCESCLRK
jgi:hypothetical protein